MFRVEWDRSATNELAEIWQRATDRNAITAAVGEIDRILATSPSDAGEQRSGVTRILFVAPLGLTFDVSESDRTATVLNVWRFQNSR